MEHVDAVHCSYDQPNQTLFEYHVFSTLTLIPVAGLLLYNTYLRRLYVPLARLVNTALILRMVSAVLFFLYYPYQNGTSNCPEIVLSKVTTMVEMFAELHQVYFLGIILGIGNFNVCLFRNGSLSLVQVLKAAFISMVATIAVSLFFFSGALSCVEDLCTIFVAVTQIYVIRLAESARDDHVTNSLVSANDSSISVFKNLSTIQLFLSICSLSFRFTTTYLLFPDPDLNSIISIKWQEAVPTMQESMLSAAPVMLAIDFFCTYLFYVKVILVRERSKHVSIEITQHGGSSSRF